MASSQINAPTSQSPQSSELISTSSATKTTLSPSGIPGFTALSSSVFLHQPANSTSISTQSSSATQAPPDLILLLGWMGASPRHVSKYTSSYMELFPSTPILALTTTISDVVFTSTAQNITRVAPALKYIQSLTGDIQKQQPQQPQHAGQHQHPRILVHLFSNGGAYTLTLLLEEHKRLIGALLPVTALILDSSPGRATLSRTIAAMTVSLPPSVVVRFLAVQTLRFMYCLFALSYIVTRRVDLIEVIRRKLNDAALLPVEGRRVYVYSASDDMVLDSDVEDHAEEAEGRGWVVRRERFVGTGHAAHVRADPERYWGIVKEVWNQG